MTSSNKSATDTFELHIDVVQADSDPIGLLSAHCALSRQQLKTAMQKGAVWLASGKQVQRLRRAKRALKPGQVLHFYHNPNVLTQPCPDATLIADHRSFSVWHKPFGMLCQGSKWSDHSTIQRFAEQMLQRPTFIVHRLDKATTGLILVAHSKTACRHLADQFANGKTAKQYRAIVQGEFTRETLTIDTPIDNKTALSQVHKLVYDKQRDVTLVQVDIKTGRKHQIRKHLSSVGFAIVGDRLHGQASDQSPDLRLAACKLSFDCPDTEERLVFSLPEEFLLNL